MLQQLGVMLCSERERMGKKQKDIADGIISIAELSRVEAGEQEIDYFTLQALFERLGKSIDKLEIAVSNSEYESISYRIGIERSIESWDCEKLAKLLSRYYDCECNDSKRPIHRQYKMAMEAMCCYVQERDYAACMNRMEHALACTSQKDWRQKIRNKQHLCNQEIRIILVITYCQWKLGSTDGLTVRLEQLGRYILHHYTDMEEQVKVYPHCAWLLGRIYLEQNEIAEACAMCRKGKKVLIENGSLSPLWEILELEAACLERMDRQTELSRCRKYQESVLFLHKAAGVQFESNMMATFMRSSFQGEFVITNELVRNLREAQGLTQEKLCAEICSQETLSRIEKGKRKPNKKKLYQLLKKMGMERENYYGFIEAQEYELYEKVREYNRTVPNGRWDKAVKLLDEIESGVDMNIPVNKQFVGMGRIVAQTIKKQLSPAEANQQLRELLHLTMPPLNTDKMLYRVPFRTEYAIWNKIAINLKEDGRIREAIEIYEELVQCYERSRVSMRYHAVPGLTLYINYTGFLEEHDDLERAEIIGKEGLQHSLECCRGDIAGDILANLSLVYGKRGLPDAEETYLRYGYYLICLYDRENMIDILQNAYRDKFQKEID